MKRLHSDTKKDVICETQWSHHRHHLTKPIVTVAWTKDNGGIPSQPNLKSNPSTKLIVWFRDGRPAKKGLPPHTALFLLYPAPSQTQGRFFSCPPLRKGCPVPGPSLDWFIGWLNEFQIPSLSVFISNGRFVWILSMLPPAVHVSPVFMGSQISRSHYLRNNYQCVKITEHNW